MDPQWIKTATRKELDEAIGAIREERERRRSLPFTDYTGRKWDTEHKANCAFDGCRGCGRCSV